MKGIGHGLQSCIHTLPLTGPVHSPFLGEYFTTVWMGSPFLRVHKVGLELATGRLVGC